MHSPALFDVRPLLIATVAALLGGVSLAGGRGSAAGLLAGALSVALLTQIVAVAYLPDYSTPWSMRRPC